MLAAKALLNDRELEAYDRFCASKEAAVSPVTAAKMFSLFVNGSDCEEIAKHSHPFNLGQVVHARVLGNWDVLKEEHLEKLLLEVRGRVQQVQLESVMLVADAIAATNKFNGDAIKKFLLSGNPNDLDGTMVSTLSAKNYKELIELLLKLTGQDVQKTKGEVTVVHSGDVGVSVRKPITQEKAAEIVQQLKKNR